ncbi:MAG: ATP-binding protein, partial [Desulfobacterales bacterium]|nr:ATP-binding protein [Desulfobacterales bacterium]
MDRKITDFIKKDLDKKLVFLVGPRQVGKTWLAKKITEKYGKPVYLNYDNSKDRTIIKDEAWLSDTDILILDEIHKMRDWKNYLKGIYDTKPQGMSIMVTGSARIDLLRQSGDSMAGRFYVHRIMPFSLSELKETEYANDMERLINRGGFPEPFLAESDNDAQRWRNWYSDSLIREDVLDFERINDFKAMKLVFEMLRQRVGSPLSYRSIALDIGTSPATVMKYVRILEALYIVFAIYPYSNNIARSILKEPKIYFYDNGLVDGDSGVKYENFIALSLLKSIYLKNDLLGQRKDLKYLRTKEGKEIDFCVVDNNKIEYII